MMIPGMNPKSTSERSPVCLAYLVDLVHLVYPVSLVQPNKQDKPIKRDRPDRPNRPKEQNRLADFFSILATERETVYGA
jgi:hypothetical protein